MFTPSGRFQPDKKICFSMSDFHPGSVSCWIYHRRTGHTDEILIYIVESCVECGHNVRFPPLPPFPRISFLRFGDDSAHQT